MRPSLGASWEGWQAGLNATWNFGSERAPALRRDLKLEILRAACFELSAMLLRGRAGGARSQNAD
jgi:hypothetical protein